MPKTLARLTLVLMSKMLRWTRVECLQLRRYYTGSWAMKSAAPSTRQRHQNTGDDSGRAHNHQIASCAVAGMFCITNEVIWNEVFRSWLARDQFAILESSLLGTNVPH